MQLLTEYTVFGCKINSMSIFFSLFEPEYVKRILNIGLFQGLSDDFYIYLFYFRIFAALLQIGLCQK